MRIRNGRAGWEEHPHGQGVGSHKNQPRTKEADGLIINNLGRIVNLSFDSLVLAAVEVASRAHQEDSAALERLALQAAGLAHDVWQLAEDLAEYAEAEVRVAA